VGPLRRRVHLKIAIAEHPHTAAIRNGSIPIEGVDAEFVTVKPQIGAFRRMVRDVEFDVCELAPTTYIIARAYGAPFVGAADLRGAPLPPRRPAGAPGRRHQHAEGPGRQEGRRARLFGDHRRVDCARC
jgi:hypothetical protein